ncbi:uncharacterized protein BO66DRAFT_260397 [Aspergillus aculeatinus CBS 121060]|uniref:Uncharacterized protein n=1 Tax=Aspergillus aculeatinus CBS 121060 TaxID=1448322 RepID=A0ACD1GRH2_9EURO|nr:hypothetical protein BO66DRAFT_260397 [Aspergillus aculeatinus CBS 121060]RAH63809.1 hypothetical protein BO66DRAFT_260397 [Aspergillus aculeatinus CBS 121060]
MLAWGGFGCVVVICLVSEVAWLVTSKILVDCVLSSTRCFLSGCSRISSRLWTYHAILYRLLTS